AQAIARAHGIVTIGDLRARTGDELVTQFGHALGRHLWNLARARDDREVVPDHAAQSISHETTFAADLRDADACIGVLLRLTEGVGRRLRQAGLVGATVRLKLRYRDFTTVLRQGKVSPPTDDDLAIHRTAKALFTEHWSGRPVRLLGVGVANLEPAPPAQQRSLFGGRRHADLLRAVDAIREKFGDDKLRRGATGG